MKRFSLLFCLFFLALHASAQTLGGYPLVDWLVTASHPNNCNATYVTGPPNNQTWVNTNPYTMTGSFGQSHANTSGYDLLLESSFHGMDLEVRLVLAGGQLSAPHTAGFADWTYVNHVLWQMLLPNCFPNMLNGPRLILPLDFETHFGLLPGQTVTGIQVNFFAFGGPDFAGAYIIGNIPCPPVNLGPDVGLCAGQTVPLNAATAGATYLWQNGSTDSVFTATQPGTYWVTVSSFCGISTDTIQVFTGTAPTVNLGPDTIICAGQTLPLDATFAGATYQWSNTDTTAFITVSQAGQYWVTVSNNCGLARDTLMVGMVNSPTVDLGADSSICANQTVTLNAAFPDASYLWSDNSTGTEITVSQAGIYWVQVYNQCGSSRDSVEISVLQAPVLELGVTITLCEGQQQTISAEAQGVDYLWHTNSTAPAHTISAPETIWVTLSNRCGTATDSVVALYNSAPVVNLGPDTTICPGNAFTLSVATANATYQWHDNSAEPTFLVTQPGIYAVQVTVNNCMASDSVMIEPFCETDLTMPNIFTPNGDGINDFFAPANPDRITGGILKVYNRWGKRVFETSDLNTGWGGSNCTDGVYFWSLEYTTLANQTRSAKGSVSLQR